MPPDEDLQLVGRALRVLGVTSYCRSQAEALGKCIQAHPNRVRKACAGQNQAFAQCMPGRTNPENYTRGMAELRNLAGRQCPAEVAAYQKALAAHGDNSMAEAMADLAVLTCAARIICSEKADEYAKVAAPLQTKK